MMERGAELRVLLHRVRRRWFTLVAMTICSRAFAAAAVAIALAAAADRWLRPGDSALLVLGAGVLLALGAISAVVVWPFRKRPDDRRVARFIEERCPDLDDAIAAAVDTAAESGAHTAFTTLVVDGALARLRALDTARVIDPASVRRRAIRTAGALAALVIVIVLAGGWATRTIEVAWLRLLPATITVDVAPGDVRVPAGRPLTIVARLAATAGTLSRIRPTAILDVKGEQRAVPMEPTATGYELKIAAVDRSFAYRVVAGAASSNRYTVTALFPPHVQRIDLHYDYPPFTRLGPRDETDAGDIYAPGGTRVRVRVRTDKPIVSGRLAMSEGKAALPLQRLDDRTFESQLTIKEEAAYRVALADGDGLQSEGTEYFIRLVDDRPPEVHILRPSGDQQITPLEEVTIEARADDDYGVASMDLVYSVAGRPENVVQFTANGGTPLARLGSRLLAAEDLSVKPGDVITYYARARDVARGKQSTLARSEMFFLEVKPFNEEYVLAQSQAMAAATGTQIESLIAAQKEIISATWNLERRGSAGRSASDVKAIADAQAELKGRAEQASGALRPRRRSNEPPQQVRPQVTREGGADPVADAIEAMNRAVQQLETLRTADAIPHQMNALNALLKAQAEVRRRQVTQQNNGSNGGGNGRQGQDLSTLFDRELKRQQRTNYESGATVEQQPERKDDAALDRIRDLARRQEDLSRRQRELAAAGLSAEELKRQLETLTREQQELQRQAEELQKQLDQRSQGSQGSQGSGSSNRQTPSQQPGATQSGRQGGQTSAQGTGADQKKGDRASQDAAKAVRDALEQMKDAASDLRRDDPKSAAARGEQAAQRLRDAESRAQGGAPDAGKRAIGEVQLEAQQIADAQRRIAGEAERLDRAGGGTADDRRRVSGEKEQLADRVDALQQNAERAAKDQKGGGDRGAMADAARELAAQKIGDRMRAGARAMRDGQAKGAARGEQQIADALDSVARRMSGADAGGAKGDTQRLADQLDQLRGARERLAQIERQLREAKDGANAARDGRQGGRAGRSGPDGRSGRSGGRGDGQAGGDVAALEQQYARELQQTRQLLDRMPKGAQESSRGTSTPEEHEWSRSAPGTESWKQDFGAWETLGKDVAKSLERYETNVAAKLAQARLTDRLHGGGSERVPDAYRDRVARYFESLARLKGSPEARKQ